MDTSRKTDLRIEVDRDYVRLCITKRAFKRHQINKIVLILSR